MVVQSSYSRACRPFIRRMNIVRQTSEDYKEQIRHGKSSERTGANGEGTTIHVETETRKAVRECVL